jgi:hypothetical protein
MMSRKLWLLAAVSLLSMIAFSSTSAMAADEKCKGTKLTAPLLAENDSGVTGTATICITAGGVRAQVQAGNLTAGNDYTLWFIYFDEPSQCVVPGACTDADVFTPTNDPEGVFGRYDSTTAIGTSATFLGHSGLIPSSGSVISLEIVAHGAPDSDGKHRARQLLTPQIPILGAPGLGTESDGTVGNPIAAAQFTIQ